MSVYDLNGAPVPVFIFLFGGLILLVYSMWIANIYARLKHWVKIQGAIIESHLDHSDPFNPNLTGRNYYYVKDVVYYKPVLKYKYRYSGHDFVGKKVSYSAG